MLKQEQKPAHEDAVKLAAPVKDVKTAPREEKPDVTASLPPEPREPAVREKHEPKSSASSSGRASRTKEREKDMRARLEREKAAREAERRHRVVRNDQPRYIRAGSNESRGAPTFSDIFRR